MQYMFLEIECEVGMGWEYQISGIQNGFISSPKAVFFIIGHSKMCGLRWLGNSRSWSPHIVKCPRLGNTYPRAAHFLNFFESPRVHPNVSLYRLWLCRVCDSSFTWSLFVAIICCRTASRPLSCLDRAMQIIKICKKFWGKKVQPKNTNISPPSFPSS